MLQTICQSVVTRNITLTITTTGESEGVFSEKEVSKTAIGRFGEHQSGQVLRVERRQLSADRGPSFFVAAGTADSDQFNGLLVDAKTQFIGSRMNSLMHTGFR